MPVSSAHTAFTVEVNRAELAIAMVHGLRAVLPHLEEDRSGEVVHPCHGYTVLTA